MMVSALAFASSAAKAAPAEAVAASPMPAAASPVPAAASPMPAAASPVPSAAGSVPTAASSVPAAAGSVPAAASSITAAASAESTAATSVSAVAAANVQSRIEQAAREHLMSFATRAGLADAQVRVSVVARSGVAAPCSPPVTIEAVDTRNLTRMRFAALCGGGAPVASTQTARAEYIARGTITAQIVVASADIAANRPIAAAQVARERRDVSSVASPVSDIDTVVGQSSRRAIRAGNILSTRWLAQAVLVKRGAPVRIVARNAGIEVTVAGEALEAGRRNEIVHVRNVGNGKVITARVVEESTVEPASGTEP
jgi:flagellar basal body P-ring formation protein FlgA